MTSYWCFVGAPDRAGLLYGHHATILYDRDYTQDRRSGRYVPARHNRKLIGKCPIHGVVYVLDRRNIWPRDFPGTHPIEEDVKPGRPGPEDR